MSEIISEISIYLILAILLGYTFGWLITKSLSKENIKENNHNIHNTEELESIKEERLQCKTENRALLSENNKVLLENREQKLKIHHLLKKLQERDLLIKTKNKHLEELHTKHRQHAKEHELEILAFIKEREEILERAHPSKN